MRYYMKHAETFVEADIQVVTESGGMGHLEKLCLKSRDGVFLSYEYDGLDNYQIGIMETEDFQEIFDSVVCGMIGGEEI